MSRMILGPIGEQLARKTMSSLLTVLYKYIPFAFLPQPGKANGDPLIAEHELSTRLPLQFLGEFAKRSGPDQASSRAVAVLADPVF